MSLNQAAEQKNEVPPHGWQMQTIGQVIKRPPSYGINAAAVPLCAGLPTYLRITDITDEGRFNRDNSVGVKHANAVHYYLEPGDLVFARTGASTGKSYYYDGSDGRLVFAGFLLKISPDVSQTKPAFLAYAVKTKQFSNWLKEVSQRSGQPGINGAQLSSYSFWSPPVGEQLEIASVLKDIDDLIASLDALIAKKRDIKQAAMQHLLTGKTRLPGFTGEWATIELGTLCSMKSGIGITSKSISEDGPYPVFGANGTRGFASTKTHNGVFPLIGRVGALCGNIQIARGDFFASEHAIVAEPKGKTDPEWLALALSRLGLNRLSEASAQPVLTVGKLAVRRLYAPTDPLEQREISRIIFAMEAELSQLAIKRGKLCEIREGMMQQLLTGRIRLV